MATIDPRGRPQANPAGSFVQDDGTTLIGGCAGSVSTARPNSS
ncbi:hypothetical protein ACWC0C_04940 [Streptomyces sp. NPDC001709]